MHQPRSNLGLLCLVAGAVWASPQTADAKCAATLCSNMELMLGNEARERCFNTDARCAADKPYGCFKGGKPSYEDKSVRRPGQPKKWVLAKPIGYIDPDGVHWDVPAGFPTDGASIPTLFKPFIGGSWNKHFVRAAIVHDFFIRCATQSPERVHKVFFQALLAGGTEPDIAKKMHWAVRTHGPKWRHIDLSQYERNRRARMAEITRYNRAFHKAYEESRRRDREEAKLPPEQRTQFLQSDDDWARFLGPLLKPDGEPAGNCVEGPDGICDRVPIEGRAR